MGEQVTRSGRIVVIVMFAVAFAMLLGIGYYVMKRISQQRDVNPPATDNLREPLER